jgi:outer membrane protein TolC
VSGLLAAALGVALGAGPAAAPIPAVGFDVAVERAIARAPLALQAAADVRRAEGERTIARSGALPSLTANGTATRLDSDRDLNGRVVTPRDQLAANLNLTLPLVAPTRWTSWAHASEALEATRLGEVDVRRAVALGAGRAYLTVLAQRRAVEVARTSTDTARAHRDYSQARRQGGVGNQLDLLRAEQQLATSEAQLEAALDGLARSREALGLATGEEGPLDAAAEPALAGGVADEAAVVDRSDVRAARQRLENARHVARDTWVEYLPLLLGIAQPFAQDPASSTTPSTGWQAQLVLSLPLYEGGLRGGERRQRDALADRASVDVDATLRQARSEVRTAAQSVVQAEAALGSSRRASESARRALELAQQAYAAGATSNIDVVDAEQRARDAAFAVVASEDVLRQARLDLLAATGKFP